MTIRLDGRVAIVTGSGNGLGRVYALHLASLGARVVINDFGGQPNGTGRSTRPADQVVEEIRSAGGEAVASYHNVAVMSEAEGIANTAKETFGRLDILVHNAGILRDKTLPKMEESDFRAVIDVHLMGGFFCTKAALPMMYEQGYGRIVLATSSSGLYGLFAQSNYAAAKLGLVGFANALKFELERKAVLINCVAPSAMTRMTEGLIEESLVEKVGPEHVAPAVAYLSSDACTFTGRIMTAGGRHFAFDQMVETKGITFEGNQPITVDMLASRMDEAEDFSNATPFVSGHDQFLKITGVSTPKY